MHGDAGPGPKDADPRAQAFEALPAPAALTDCAGRLVCANQAFLSRFPGLAVGSPISAVKSVLESGSWITTETPEGGRLFTRRMDSPEDAENPGIGRWTFDVPTRKACLEGPLAERLGFGSGPVTIPLGEWRKRVPPEDLAGLDTATSELEHTGTATTEYRVRASDGRLHWLTFSGVVTRRAENGRLLAASGVFAETGEQRQLVQRLALRERQLADAVQAGLLGAWSVDLVTGRQGVFGEILSWMGKEPDALEIDEQDWIAIIHPEDRPAAKAASAIIWSGLGVTPLEYRLKGPEGWRWARAIGRVVHRAPDGRPVRAAGVVVDITAERAFAAALEAERARFEALYNNTPALMQSIDADGRTIMVSDYWIARLGIARDEALGRPGWSFFTPEDRERLRDRIVPGSLKVGGIENEPLTFLTRSGERLEVRLNAYWEFDADGRPLRAHGVFAEVGDLNAARHELERRAEALERANRELDRFATVASHDLQEPLRKISAFASLLRTRWKDSLDGDAHRCLDYLVDASGRMRRLIDDLLAYSRASSRPIRPEPVSLFEIWQETLEVHEALIGEAEARIHSGDLPAALGDRVLLRLMFANLLSNALKYRKGPGVKITLDAAIAGGRVRLVFADDGIGFEQRFAQKVFEPFSRLHPRDEYNGTGIGLAICQQAVERQGGSISVRSAPGAGAAFTVDLPAAS